MDEVEIAVATFVPPHSSSPMPPPPPSPGVPEEGVLHLPDTHSSRPCDAHAHAAILIARAALLPPPWIFVEIGSLSGPVSPRRLTQAAQIHTCAPLATESGKRICALGLLKAPRNCHCVGSAGK